MENSIWLILNVDMFKGTAKMIYSHDSQIPPTWLAERFYHAEDERERIIINIISQSFHRGLLSLSFCIHCATRLSMWSWNTSVCNGTCSNISYNVGKFWEQRTCNNRLVAHKSSKPAATPPSFCHLTENTPGCFWCGCHRAPCWALCKQPPASAAHSTLRFLATAA